MSHFYGSMRGNRGEATRQGTKNSGITAHVRSWNMGVEVRVSYDETTHTNTFVIVQTGGSNNPRTIRKIATLREVINED